MQGNSTNLVIGKRFEQTINGLFSRKMLIKKSSVRVELKNSTKKGRRESFY